ncbi:MAG TPA: cyclic peptide export ABC transporter [Roseiflexaceae bacterium]|nr:cyclic peptide export ABC transporter [Roseiflexaceae bacterium]
MTLLRLLPRRARWVVALAVLFGVVNSLSSIGIMTLINATLRSGVYGPSILALAFAGLVLLSLVSRVVSQSLLIRLSEQISADLRRDLGRRILGANLASLEAIGAHRLLALLTQDVAYISDALVQIPSVAMVVSSLLLALVYLGWLSWPVLLAVLVSLGLGIATFQLMLRSSARLMERARQDQDDLYGHFGALTGGVKELKLHAPRRAAFYERLFEPTLRSFQHHNVRGKTLNTIAYSWSDALLFLVIGSLFFVVPLFERLDAVTLATGTFILFYLIGPLGFLLQLVPMFINGSIALGRVETLLPPTEGSPAVADAPPAAWRSLELVDVTHTYQHEQQDSGFVVGPVRLAFRPGELVILMGGNGSGKTTLAKLLVGLYRPESGAILLDGQPVTDADRENYRQLFTVVFADFYLFDQLLGLLSPTLDEQARDYLHQLQLAHKVEVRDGRFSTIDLSQGQRKRLALLTAYLEDRPFYLFDEWAADQDPVFKEIFYTQMLPDLKRRGKTVVVISHDDRYFGVADRLIKLDYGKVEYDTVAVGAVLDRAGQPSGAGGEQL